jgi:hypothetical protein
MLQSIFQSERFCRDAQPASDTITATVRTTSAVRYRTLTSGRQPNANHFSAAMHKVTSG